MHDIIDWGVQARYVTDMITKFIRKDDQAAVLRHVGRELLVLFREALDEGFFQYTRCRDRDPDAFLQYSDCTRANILNDHMTAAAREMIDAMAINSPELIWKISANRRATEIFYGDEFVFRIKRTKRNRRGCTANVATWRQKAIKSEVGYVTQAVLPYSGNHLVLPDFARIWLTIGFDLDELEESLERVMMGVEVRRRFLWKVPLPVPEQQIIASLSPALADKILELRVKRSA